MILFLYADSLNYARTPGVVHAELKARSSADLNVMDVGLSGPEKIKQIVSGAEMILFDNSILLAITSGQIFSLNFSLLQKKPVDFYREVWSIVNHSGKPVFLLAPMSDLHVVNFGLERPFFLEMIHRLSGIFWQYYKCPVETDTALDRYPYTTLAPFHLGKTDVIRIWEEITGTIKINIDLPNCVSPDEMIEKSPRKKWDFIVPGASYQTRQIALKSAQAQPIRVAPYYKYYRWLINAPHVIYGKIFSDAFSARIVQKHGYRLYQYMISHSFVSFVCGSELKYNVRKYWEVPAWRTAMLAYPTHSLRDYGFEDGIHYLQTFPEEAGEKTIYLLKNKNIADKLVQNAWELVARQHVASERVNQVLSCLHFFKQGKLKGACFKNGQFEIF